MFRIIKWFGIVLLSLVVALVGWLAIAPPDLIRVGANYTAKIVCSNVFLAGRDPQEVLKIDVQAPGHPILSFMKIDVDVSAGEVRAGLFGLFGKGFAIHRSGYGCTAVPDGDRAAVVQLKIPEQRKELSKEIQWPLGEKTENSSNKTLDKIINNPDFTGPDMRAIVVVNNGAIIAERYGEGFDAKTPLLGWSMSKTLTSALVGRFQNEGLVEGFPSDLHAEWSSDQRAKVKLSDLLAMASGLDWNEGYGAVSDVTRMLYLEPNMKEFVANKPLTVPSGSDIGKTFNYSSGTSVLIGDYLMKVLKNAKIEAHLANDYLFTPLGMTSAVMEADARGNFVSGSYTYASARDWARLGQFLLQKGRWNNQQLLPDGFVDWMSTVHEASDGKYGKGHVWRREPYSEDAVKNPVKADHPTFWLAGHDGQSVAIVPNQNLVVVRMGLTPSKLGYQPAIMLNEIVKAVAE